MTFRQAFLNSLRTTLSLTKSISLLDYLPNFIEYNHEYKKDNLPLVQAYGNIFSSYPYYYEISHLDTYCLIQTTNGSGTLTFNNQGYTLTSDTLALFDCKELHRVEIKQSSWNYNVIFFNGLLIPSLYKLISSTNNVITLSPNSTIPFMIERFITQKDKNEPNSLLDSKMILDIMYEIIFENKRQSEISMSIPNYLVHIKKDFDSNYNKNYSLYQLEQDYRISKYRICREFSKYYALSPFQYLNNKRIEIAKKHLIQTDKQVNEIGHLVGFENTNHFIRLFKKQNGVTPLEFRRQSPIYTHLL